MLTCVGGSRVYSSRLGVPGCSWLASSTPGVAAATRPACTSAGVAWGLSAAHVAALNQ